FELTFLNVTPGWNAAFFDLTIRNATTSHSYDFSRDLINAVQPDGSATIQIPFSKFGGANMAQVSQIEINAARVQSTAGLAIDLITVVPEPSLAALLGAGLILTRIFGNGKKTR